MLHMRCNRVKAIKFVWKKQITKPSMWLIAYHLGDQKELSDELPHLETLKTSDILESDVNFDFPQLLY